MNLTKIILTRCQIFHLKCTKFNFQLDSVPDPAAAAHSAAPDLLAGFGEGKGKERWRQMGKGRGRVDWKGAGKRRRGKWEEGRERGKGNREMGKEWGRESGKRKR